MKILFPVLFLMILAASCKKDSSNEGASGTLKLSFQLLNDGQPLNTTDQYLNLSGETYTVSVFKFYVTNIKLITSGNQAAAEPESYHLVDLSKPESKEISPSFTEGTYTKIEFLVGVDSTRNVSGAQTGALDPMNGMFWTWNSGYIFAKLEGHSPASTAPGQAITYHIGGFKTGENAIRKVTLSFPADKPAIIGKTSLVVINVDLSKWFDGPQTISISQSPSIMTPGGVSLKIADNYASMFSIQNVINP